MECMFLVMVSEAHHSPTYHLLIEYDVLLEEFTKMEMDINKIKKRTARGMSEI